MKMMLYGQLISWLLNLGQTMILIFNVLCKLVYIKQCSKACQYTVIITKQRHWNQQKTKEKALQILVSITKTSPSHRNLVVQNDDAITTILLLLNSSSHTLEKLSLSILFNLSLNPNLKSTLADMATIQHLNTIILSRGSLESSKLAASLICSLAMLDKNKAVFGVSNTIQALLKAVSRPKGHVTHHLLSSLAELAHFHGNCTLAVRSGAVNVLLRIVENEDCKDLSGTALAILELLARFDEGLKALINTPNIVSRMLDVLKGRCMMSNEGAAEVLIRVFDESEECLKEAMRLPDLMFVLAELSVRGSTRAREKASLLLKKLEANELYAEDNLVFLKWPSWLRGADFGQSRWQKWGSSGKRGTHLRSFRLSVLDMVIYTYIVPRHLYDLKKEKSMAGDWVCGTCQRQNFHWRTKCRRCNEPFVSLSLVQTCAHVPRVRNYTPGDWFCDAGLCRAHNFANRQFCFKCGVIKSIPPFDASVGYHNPVLPPVNFEILGQRVARISRRGWTTGDWFCCRPDCNAHNYGPRIQCYKCKSPRDLVSNVSN
ncbi:hypothetical protein L1987_00038 [Smallanthus sonchifolius]|uniref:Uncharacterized protein n=1 Tax=Smallanthus sonchifolius TaxID=185202 RepID=A0ACB9K163_9ASTR|nr:hypothetical protein L1987_00038 [Smallanthus sonchifolius]